MDRTRSQVAEQPVTDSDFFLDTNVIIRFLADDHPELSPKARAILTALETGSASADISDTVIFECIYVMTKQYKMTRDYMVDVLVSLLSLESVRTSSKSTLLEALGVWSQVQRLSFADALHLVWARRSVHKRIATFDKGMDNCLPGVTRVEQFP
jgi:predicted nucleic-acid-binding protein